MTLQTIKSGVWVPPIFNSDPTPAFGGMTIDASGEKAAAIIRVPKTGNISKVGFRTQTVTTPETLRVGLQTVSAANGDPTGSAYGGMTVGTQAAPASNTGYTVTLGTAASATAGDLVAAVIEFDSSVGNLVITDIALAQRVPFPYGDLFAGSWAKRSVNAPVLWLEYDDGTYEAIDAFPFTAITTTNYASNSTPDERALRFVLPVPSRLLGAWFISAITANMDLVLYEGTTVRITQSFDGEQAGSGSMGIFRTRFPSPYSLTAGTEYFLSMKPTTTNNVSINDFTVASAAVLDSLAGGQAFHLGTRVDGGAWTKTTTQRPMIGLILDQFDDGAGGGGGGIIMPRSLNGGLV